MELKTMRIGKICIEGIIVDSYAEAQKKVRKIEREECFKVGMVQLKNKKWLISGQFEELRKLAIPMGV